MYFCFSCFCRDAKPVDLMDIVGGSASASRCSSHHSCLASSLGSRNRFGFKDEWLSAGGSRMWTPGQSGTCSPALPAGVDQTSVWPSGSLNLPFFFPHLGVLFHMRE
ncbi:hypothetical protein V6N13_093848 [Hibiscus sabdariffa]|uniref:Protein BZR1 homolog n=1 Tax=Hibiscus sabdariffa TaxID=183260 RepID=A0ABR2NKS4_9ROSI